MRLWIVCSVLAASMSTGCSRPPAEPTEAPATPTQRAPKSSGDDTSHQRKGEATLILLSDIRGVLRPCGCTVDLQKGGFDRLGPHLNAERSAHPGLKVLHAGPLFFDTAEAEATKQAQRKRQSELAAQLSAMVDLEIAGATTVDVAAAGERYATLIEQAGLTVTAANLHLKQAPKTIKPWQVQTIGQLQVGIFALASPKDAKHIGEIATISDPIAAARDSITELREKSDVIILLSALGLRDTKRLVRKVPGIDFALAGGLGEHPVFSDEAELVKNTRVLQLHREGRFVARLSVRMVPGSTEFVDASAPSTAELEAMDARITQLQNRVARLESESSGKESKANSRALRSARHHLESLRRDKQRRENMKVKIPANTSSFSYLVSPLPWDLPQDPEILSKMDAFDEELKSINLANVGALPEAKPGQAVYVGVDTCLECHDETQTFWDHSAHAHAWETLEKLNKTFDTECISCHVTGYMEPGGSILGNVVGREDAQCEVCHGPGSLHVDAAAGQEKATIIGNPGDEVCTTCHNAHHSPDFDYETWRAKVLVPGHGRPSQ